MGRHSLFSPAVLLGVVLTLVATACGLTPADEELAGSDGDCPTVARPAPVEIDLGVILELDSAGADHVLCEVAYASSPPTSGPHFPAWQNCGFYTEPIRDETAVHSLEHGAVWIAYDPDLDPVRIGEIEAIVALDGHFLASPYPGLQNPIVVSAWQRQLALEQIGEPVFTEFIDRQLGRVSETAPEAGVSCADAVGGAPDDPDLGFDDARQFFMDR
ncbi:MAG: DUF3105 domain-containing protein [Actinomycetota bacterium]